MSNGDQEKNEERGGSRFEASFVRDNKNGREKISGRFILIIEDM